jgi:hypothetical protein
MKVEKLFVEIAMKDIPKLVLFVKKTDALFISC